MPKFNKLRSSGSESGIASTQDSYEARSTVSLPTDNLSSSKALDSRAEPMSLAQRILFDDRRSKTAAYVRHLEKLEEFRISQQDPNCTYAFPASHITPPLSANSEQGENNQQLQLGPSDSDSTAEEETLAEYLRLDLGETISFQNLFQQSPWTISDEVSRNVLTPPTSPSRVTVEMRNTQREDGPQLSMEPPGHDVSTGNPEAPEPSPTKESSVDKLDSEKVKASDLGASDRPRSSQSSSQYKLPSEDVKGSRDDAPTIRSRSNSATDLSSCPAPFLLGTVIPSHFRMSLYGRKPSNTDLSLDTSLSSKLSSAALPTRPERICPSSSATQPRSYRQPEPPPSLSPFPSPSPSPSSTSTSTVPTRLPPRPPAPNAYELSTSDSVIHKPHLHPAKQAPQHARCSYGHTKIYNTLPGEAFPIFSTRTQPAVDAGGKKSGVCEGIEAGLVAQDGKDRESSVGVISERLALSIEPDIDPRTGRKWVGSWGKAWIYRP